jgi:hypothetical protein
MTHSEYENKVKTVRYFRGDIYMGWQSYSWKMRFLEIRDWLASHPTHSVKVGRLHITMENINALPVNQKDFVKC